MSKILFIDVDGTLVDYQNRLPESAVEAIRCARSRGHRVYICTGRSKAEVYQNIWDIGLDGMIGGNGCFIKSGDTVVFHQLIPADVERRMVDWLTERGLCFYLESNNGLFASPTFETEAVPAARAYNARKGREFTSVAGLFHGMVFDLPMEELYRDDLNKVSFILNSYQDYLDAVKDFPDLKVGTWGGRDEEALFGDFGVKDIDKAKAIEVLLKHLFSFFVI